ncbi:hypothetical protein GCM10009784_07840 [Arthrobacter parietis]|uniref:DNA-binding protein n=1 Tax=Arthrobacter parietis TaxID=271434 RepID=A0ABN3AR63_9MICC
MNLVLATRPLPLPVPGEHLTRVEAALYLGRSIGTLENWAASKIGPPFVYAMNGIVLYPGCDLVTYMQDCVVYTEQDNQMSPNVTPAGAVLA